VGSRDVSSLMQLFSPYFIVPPSKELHRSKFGDLVSERDGLFKYGVVPGFWIGASRWEISPLPSLVAGLLVPVAASILRNVLILYELIQANRLVSLTLSAILDDFGIIPPNDDRLL